MVRSRRRWLLALAGLTGVIVLLWAPSLVAWRYNVEGSSDGPLWRPDKGWGFLYEAVRQSRGTKLGTERAALDEARRRWPGTRGRAESVRLGRLDRPFRAQVPRGGVRPAPGNQVVRPRSPLGWLIYGSVRGRPRQLIGVLDYNSGRPVWDIRPPLRGSR